MQHLPRTFNVLTLLLVTTAAVFAAERQATIANPLGLNWPGDLTHIDFPAGTFDGDVTVGPFADARRPVQVQHVIVDGQSVDRAWFVATLDGKQPVDITFAQGKADSPLRLTETDEYYLIDNSVYQFRVRRYQAFDQPVPLGEVPHWIAGMRVHETDAWDGRAWFEGNARVTGVETEIIERGPVFVQMRITYRFADAQTGATTEAMPLANGKQTHTFEPNQLPRETIAKLSRHYEVLVRFVADDPWIDINERYHLPRDGAIEPWGIHQYWIAWGKPQDMPAAADQGFDGDRHMPIDSVAWVRWFEYDKFGGNIDMKIVPAEPRPAQKGRPFALLRPRWNQGGGGAQDFVLTSGGRGEQRNRKGEVTAPADEGYSPDNSAVGVVAAYASKWVGPYPATIAAYAYDRERGRARFPMIDGERSGQHYGQRAYGLLVGPRKLFDATWKINSMVRRHTDWTLVAQMNKYVLEWQRDPAKAGPYILINREQLEALQAEVATDDDSPIDRVVRAELAKLDEVEQQRAAASRQIDAQEAIMKDKEQPKAARDAAKARRDELRKKHRDLGRELDNDDVRLLKLIAHGETSDVGTRFIHLWLDRRYQDDFLNPTSQTTRGLPKMLMLQDLYAGGEPIGGPMHAVIGYIFTDLDQWPGWKNGWNPGNPNFHTDKYQVALFAGAALRDHPHADEWLAFGLDNFREDIEKVISAPHGVGYECPGYAGYSIRLQLNNARVIANTGFENPVTSNPLFKETATWHRQLLTPFDKRIGVRHEAPIGDTHRWTSGLGPGFGELATFYRQSDPELASQLMGIWRYLEGQGYDKKLGLRERLIAIDPRIEPTAMTDNDWSSQAFKGFGAVMRTGFDTEQETFVSIKAGWARGHYHNDDLSYHYYADGTPISLDYNCSYDPRGDHAALHNSMTFGRLGTVRHNQRDVAVEAQEQIGSSGKVLAFGEGQAGDAIVAERRSRGVTLSPIDPHDAEFSRRYPSRQTGPIVHRRTLALIKHSADHPMTDYLAVRDQTLSDEPQQLNLHVLAADAKIDGNTVHLTGQWDKDIVIYFADATDLDIAVRQWHYKDEWMTSPGDEYTIRPGESIEDWRHRMEKLMADHDVDSLPLPGWQPKWQNPKESGEWFKLIEETEGKALVPPPYWNEKWMYGEYQVWLRCATQPGTPITWVMYAYPRGTPPPTFEPVADGRGVKVSLAGKSETVMFEEGVRVERDGQVETIISADQLTPMSGQGTDELDDEQSPTAEHGEPNSAE